MSCERFVSELLGIRVAAHLLHLSTESYAQHMALGEFYEAAEGLIDRYAEVYMGLNGRVAKWPRVTIPVTSAASLLKEFLDAVKEEMASDPNSEALRSILGEMEELGAQTLYKLKVLK